MQRQVRQPRYKGHNSLNHPSLAFFTVTPSSAKCQNSEKIWTYSSSKSSKVNDLGANQKHICNFLLVISSNFGRISYRFRDTDAKQLISTPHPCLMPSFRVNPSEFLGYTYIAKTRAIGLLWWKFHDHNFNRFWLIHPCDIQTDRWTQDNAVPVCNKFFRSTSLSSKHTKDIQQWRRVWTSHSILCIWF